MIEPENASDTNNQGFLSFAIPFITFFLGLFVEEIKEWVKKKLKLDKKKFCSETINELKDNIGLIEKYLDDPILYYRQYDNVLWELKEDLPCSPAKQERYSILKGDLQKTSGKLYVSYSYSYHFKFHTSLVPTAKPFGISSNKKYFEILKFAVDIIEKSLFITVDEEGHQGENYKHIMSPKAEEKLNEAQDALILLQLLLEMPLNLDQKDKEEKIKKIKERFSTKLES